MSNDEVEQLFKAITKVQRTQGINISITKLAEKVFKAMDAILLDRMREHVLKSAKPLQELMVRHDLNKDGALEYLEVEGLLLECQLAFKTNMFARLINIMDPDRRASKVTYTTLKYYMLSDQPQSSVVSISAASLTHHSVSHDMRPSKDIHGGEDISPEELGMCRSGARKILQAYSATSGGIYEALNARDKMGEGLISREDLQRMLEEQKIPDLTGAE